MDSTFASLAQYLARAQRVVQNIKQIHRFRFIFVRSERAKKFASKNILNRSDLFTLIHNADTRASR
jgi:hypothetical protein